jgi:hypothetical protein
MGCGCLVALLVWLSPRFALVIMQLFTDKLSIAMDSFLMGALGFVFLPYTTVFYALCYAPGLGGGVSGFGWLLVALGFLLDLGSWFGGGKQAQNRQATAS